MDVISNQSGRALEGESRSKEEDWVSAELIKSEITFEGAGTAVAGRPPRPPPQPSLH
jgi:hypothetical protein